MLLSDLLAFAKAQSRIERTNYFDPRFARSDEVQAWLDDRRSRDQARKALFRAFPGRLALPEAERLLPGRYGRLLIGADGSIEYTVGQYAPTEIYEALLSYLEATN